jgi:hypothetical protein
MHFIVAGKAKIHKIMDFTMQYRRISQQNLDDVAS